MKSGFVFITLLLLLSIVGTASAAGYTSTFTSNDTVRINQSSVQDPSQGAAVPWTLWVMSGSIGIIFVTLALIKPRLYRMDYEISIILSVVAWPFLWYWTWGALTTIDYTVGAGVTSQILADGSMETAMITQHILYSFPILGIVGVAGDVAAFFITALLVGQFKLFKENEENEKQRSVSQ